MDTSEDAAFYQAHRDDDSEWGEAKESTEHDGDRLSVVVSVRLTPTQEDVLRAAAERRGESISGFLRSAALDVASGGMSRTSVVRMSYTESAVGDFWAQVQGDESTDIAPKVRMLAPLTDSSAT